MVPMPVAEDYRPRIERGEVWLLEEGGEAAALVVIEDHDDHLVVFSVAVRAARKGQGLGSALLRFADEQARHSGKPALRLYTNGRMKRQIGLYQRHGYRIDGERAHPTLPDHTLVDMSKTLDGRD
jgi:ribosomal protein S18 acetylase RimI-like enzyme